MELSERHGLGARFLRALGWADRYPTYPGGRLSERQIRLLKICSGERGTELECTVKIIQRNRRTTYKALSYAWGDPTLDKKRILINGKDFMITPSLHDALCRFREKGWSFWLWVDAICINQTDTVERNTQVQQMGEIFSGAREVIAWLGDALDDSRALRDVVHLASLGADATEDDVKTKLASLCAVFNSPWFARLWVLQEVLLARKCLVVLGSESYFITSLYPLKKAHGAIRAFSVHGTGSSSHTFGRGYTFFTDFIQYKDQISLASDTIDLFIVYLYVVLVSRGRLCEDSRDHVFGLLGIGKHLGLQTIQADYSRPTREVFQHFMQQALLRDPNVLIYLGDDSERESALDLPSWVPDFAAPAITHRFNENYSDMTYFAGGRDNLLELTTKSFSGGASVLSLPPGYSFDRVLALSEHPTVKNRYRTDDKRTERFLAAAEDILRHQSASSPYGTDRARYQAYWRTLSANRYRHYQREVSRWNPKSIPPEDNGAAFEVVAGKASGIPSYVNRKENQAIREDVAGFRHQMYRIMAGRRLCVTHTGYFCCGPRTLKEEDLIVVIPGLRLPLILRKRSNDDYYQLIGLAYVHGIMDGEFIKSVRQSPRIEAEIFHIN